MNTRVFDIGNFNIFEDENNYYFFRALNMGDIRDIENLITIDSNGRIIKIRTDRDRYLEDAKYSSDSQIALEEVYDHIKMHHRVDTNCISLTSNANVSALYGRGFYKDKYVVVKVPKKEFGNTVFNAGQYMLEQINELINNYVANSNDEELKRKIEYISGLDNVDEISLFKTEYSDSDDIDTDDFEYGIEHDIYNLNSRYYSSLNKEQNLEKNKIVAKLNIIKKNIIPNISNTRLIKTVGDAFSSLEIIKYNEIDGKDILYITSEALDILCLLQQLPHDETIKKYKNELFKSVLLNQNQLLKNNYENSLDLSKQYTIENMYNFTNGTLDFYSAINLYKKSYYLAKTKLRTHSAINNLQRIVSSDKYKDLIQMMKKKTYGVEPEIFSKHNGNKFQISESVNLDISSLEKEMFYFIDSLTSEELKYILDNPNTYLKYFLQKYNVTNDKVINKNIYYANAIIDLFDWGKLGVVSFSLKNRSDLVKKLIENNCVAIYDILKENKVEEEVIANLLLTTVIKNKDIANIDLEETFTIDELENFLGYYKIKNTNKLKLKSYQALAYKNINKIFKEKQFAVSILPTGAGKSFVALAEMLKYRDQNILYLAPTVEIINQLKQYIVENIYGETLKMTPDEIVSNIFPNLKIETYTSLISSRQDEIINQKYDLIIFDELHRTGAIEWNKKINKLTAIQDKNTKILGITATPVRDTDLLNMADEWAKNYGYTEEEIVKQKHLASNMDLVEAIRRGYVVNPKIMSCEYELKEKGVLLRLNEQINLISDDSKRNELLNKFDKLRKQVEKADGTDKLLLKNIKKGGKYIVFCPTGNSINSDNEDEKKSVLIIKKYQEIIKNYFKDEEIELYSMLGSYSSDYNAEQLNVFENSVSDNTKFMFVINKLNEGKHISNIDGLIWYRALDDNSSILYSQQLGRIIYSINSSNEIKDEDRPVVFDLTANFIRVNLHKKSVDSIPDIEKLRLAIYWINNNAGKIPNINSDDTEERINAINLKNIQEKYSLFINNDELINKQNTNNRIIIENIIELGAEIDLWNIVFSKKKNSTSELKRTKKEIEPFEIIGILKDYCEIQEELDSIFGVNNYEELVNITKILHQNGVNISKLTLSKAKDDNNGRTDRLLCELVQDGIDIQKIIEENGLDSNFKYGMYVRQVRAIYKGKREGNISDELISELLMLGVIVKENKSQVSEVIEVLKVLRDNGVILSKISLSKRDENRKQKFLMLGEIQQDGIDIQKIIEENGLDPDFKFGTKVYGIKQSLKGNSKSYMITEDEKKELMSLNLIPPTIKDELDECIKIAIILKQNGIDLKNLVLSKKSLDGSREYKLLCELEQGGVDIQKIIEENGLDINYNFGMRFDYLKRCIYGHTKGCLEHDELTRVKEFFGISNDELTKEEEFKKISNVLFENGVNLSKVNKSRLIDDKRIFLRLKDINIDGIDIQKIIEENGLDPEFEYGKYYSSFGSKLPKKQIELFTNTEPAVKRNIRIFKILRDNGVKITELPISKRISPSKKYYFKLNDISQEGIDIQKIIEENGLDPEYCYGRGITLLRNAYRGNSNLNYDESDIEEMIELGLVSKNTSQKKLIKK